MFVNLYRKESLIFDLERLNMKTYCYRIFLISYTFLASFAFAQNGTSLKGYILNESNNIPIASATVSLQGLNKTVVTDENGFFSIATNQGLYNIEISAIGFESQLLYEIQISAINNAPLQIKMRPIETVLTNVTVRSTRDKTRESPVSYRNLGINEIQRSPGGNRDISKVIQALPGAGSYSASGSFRNDILIRGGGPSENRFFVDNIEVPTINHFSTQGASGGPVGLINVDLIRNVNFLTGAFEASTGNALSSVMDIRLKEGRKDKWSGAFTVGTTDLALRAEGPISNKTSAILSARRSYFQLLFKILELPFLPTYNDFLFKTNTKFNDKIELSFVGIGAIDQFKLNKEANKTDEQKYILGYIPSIEQWNYTVGSTLRLNEKNGNTQFILSRNMLFNRYFKYTNNEDDNPAKKVNDNNTSDIDNQLKIERTVYKNNRKTNYGIATVYSKYITDAYNKIPTATGIIESSFNDQIDFWKYGIFVQSSKTLLDNRINLSAGVRFDGSSFTSRTRNLFLQPSPRLSFSYNLNNGWSINANTGLYQQLPTTTILGHRDNNGKLINQNEDLRYTQSLHGVLGVEKRIFSNLKISVEGFYKKYNNYPISKINGISLANTGAEFGIVGNEPVDFDGKGKSYGLELFVQQKLWKNFYGWLTYTYFRSFFTNSDGKSVASSWDQQHLVNLILGKRFKKNWEAGIKFRYSGGNPYTPYNEDLSSLKSYWDISGKGILDYTNINTRRIPSNYQVDFRIDKKWFFKKWNLNLYFDMQNVTQAVTTGTPIITVERNSDGTPKEILGSSPVRYETKKIDNKSKTFVETIGIIIEI